MSKMIQLGPYGAQMDPNVGTGFENTVSANDSSPAFCQGFASIFGEDPALTAKLLNTSQNGLTLNFALYTVYRPANWPSAAVPIITWGNGTCAQPEGYGALLRYVASYGYFVVAANSRQVGSGTEIRHALDFAIAANADPSSPYYQKLDATKIGAMGHSQGGGGTAAASSDSRILDVILFNALNGTSSKPYVAVSGDKDVTTTTPQAMASAANAAAKAAWIYYHNPVGMGNIRGHLVLMLSPERVEGWTVAWWDMVLKGDTASRDWFVGTSCKLCNQASDFEFGEHGLD
jgi:hypothetical protein